MSVYNRDPMHSRKNYW